MSDIWGGNDGQGIAQVFSARKDNTIICLIYEIDTYPDPSESRAATRCGVITPEDTEGASPYHLPQILGRG